MSSGSEALVLAAIDALPHDSLLAFLSRQRWFAAKGAGPSAARIVDALVVPWGTGAFALARVSAETASGAQVYQLPLAARSSDTEVPERGILAHVMIRGAAVSLYDAMHDPEFRAGLGAALAAGAVIRGADGHQWTAEATIPGRLGGMANAVSTVGAAEQSNTSVVFGNAVIFKLFRLLKPGIHPDVEVTAFLTERAHFPHTPALLANAWFDDRGERTIAGMLQEFFPGSVDAWSHTLERGRSYYAAPAGRDVDNPSTGDAHTLGAITRELHQALACDELDPAFAPAVVTPEDLDRWARRTQQSIRESLAMLDRQSHSPQFPGEHVAEAKALVGRVDHYVGWIDEIVDDVGHDLGEQIRIHGDFHLGQVLRTASGDFKIIDFEGEPSRGLAERREKASPLRDVAGMLRSYSYAAATLAMTVAEQIDPRTREIRSARWERDVRGAFLDGYLHAPRASVETGMLPEDARHIRQLVALFETEKAFYELAYELNNRPAWTWIPMRGVAKLFTR
jgi:trehalose synthase-fused probable maltokinase